VEARIKSKHLFRIFGLRVTYAPVVIPSVIVLWAVLALIGALLLDLSLVEAILGGFLGMLLWEASAIIHNLGHAWAANLTGYPMIGIRLYLILGGSIYPRDEPQLPASLHIRRALGGPLMSLGMAVVGAILAIALRSSGGLPHLLAVYFSVLNLLVFTIGALLPLGFTDGSTLLQWWGKGK
jgi:hypothetical protein